RREGGLNKPGLCRNCGSSTAIVCDCTSFVLLCSGLAVVGLTASMGSRQTHPCLLCARPHQEQRSAYPDLHPLRLPARVHVARREAQMSARNAGPSPAERPLLGPG